MNLTHQENPKDSKSDRDPQYRLHDAIENGNLADVASIITSGADVNLIDANDLTPLMCSTRPESTEILELLLQSGAEIGKLNQWGYSALHFATMQGMPSHVKILMDAGCDIELQSLSGSTPLHYACANNNPKVCELLLQSGVGIDKPDNFGLTPLHSAASCENLAVLELLVEAGANIKATAIDDSNLLHFAVRCKSPKILEKVLTMGFSIEKKNKFGQTPLLAAALARHSANAKILLDAGAYVKAKDMCQMNALHYAVKYSVLETVELFLSYQPLVNLPEENGYTPLFLALMNQDVEKTKLLLAAGADVNHLTADGTPPINYAAQYNQPEFLQLLLDAGAEVNVTDVYGTGPIHNAVKNNNPECLKLLLAAGADENLDLDSDTSPLIEAIARGTVANLELLLQNGAELTKLGSLERTPLMFATHNENPDMFKKIASIEANYHDTDIDGDTVLHIAAMEGNAVALQSILASGVEVDIRNLDGMTPLAHAARVSSECVQLLLDAGADINAKDISGAVPFLEAAEGGSFEIIEILLNAGVDANTCDERRETLLHLAAKKQLPSSFYKLSAEYEFTNSPDFMLAEFAAIQGLDDIEYKFHQDWMFKHSTKRDIFENTDQVLDLVKLLLKFKADVNATDCHGSTPLHYALQFGFADIARELLQAGAKSDIGNDKDMTAADIAAKKGLDLQKLMTGSSERIAPAAE